MAMHEHGSPARPSQQDPSGQLDDEPDHSMWWMVLCCAPMALIAVALVLGLIAR